ncbi:WxL protein host-binding domain-containing protein [Latilactobacillus fragifolii]|uniref:WxL protein host-binding domain-containing protein n=1 Tax=Latilactobacillus fragifolii TaxID=2814244 RepID=UPI001ABBB0E9|nr:DUF3324 domain-containing protein [Latilactobacillus fragifolii]
MFKQRILNNQLNRYNQVLIILTITLLLEFMMNIGTANAKPQRIKVKQDSTEPVTIQVLPQIPADNIGGQHLGYFDLPVVSKKSRIETISLYNPTNQIIKVQFKIINATTVDNGAVDYTGGQQIDKRLLKVPASTMITAPKALNIQPKTSRNVAFRVKQHSTAFVGQKAAALNIIASGINTPKSSIQNQYVYAIGIILQGRPLKKQQMKKLRPEGIKVRILQNRKAAISVKLVNPDATYLQNTTIEMRLTNQKYSFFSYQSTKKGLKVAPSSAFYNDLLLGGKRLVPGLYRLKITIKSTQYQHTTYKYVEITKGQARFINNHNYLYLKYRNRILMGVGGVLGLLIIYGIVMRIYFKSRKKRLNE